MTQPAFPARAQLSLCMIVRNEEAKLARCLASAAPWVGEIVVVDTGSTDQTVAIAESFGAKVVHFTWCDDFAAARNVALDAASREWALVLDADEELVVLNPDELARAVQQDVIDGFSFRIHNLLDSGEWSVGMVFRLFRRTKPGMRYRGRLHEQVIAVSEQTVQTAALGCCELRHDGYTQQVIQAHGKGDRNVRIARQQVEQTPDDFHAWYALGLSLPTQDVAGRVQAYEKSLALLQAGGKELLKDATTLHLLLLLAQSQLELGRREAARKTLDFGISRFPDSPDLHHARGQARFDAGDYAGAASDFERCLQPDARGCFLVLHPGTVGYAAKCGLAMAYANTGRNQEAERLLTEAVAEAPGGYGVPRRLLGILYFQRGAWAEAEPLLHAAALVEPDNQDLRFQLGWCLYKLERYDEALDALEPLKERPEALHVLGKIHLECGRAAEALALLGTCPLPAAGLARGWAYYLTGQRSAAAACWDEWMRAGAADWGTKDTLSTFLFLLDGGRRPSGQPERPAEPLRDMDQWFRLLLRHQRFDDVEAVIQRAPQLGDRLWVPLRKLWGRTLAREEYFDVALMLLLQAREAAPTDAELHYWLGYCCVHKQLLEDAAVLWESCLRLDPGYSLARQGLALLKQDSASK